MSAAGVADPKPLARLSHQKQALAPPRQSIQPSVLSPLENTDNALYDNVLPGKPPVKLRDKPRLIPARPPPAPPKPRQQNPMLEYLTVGPDIKAPSSGQRPSRPPPPKPSQHSQDYQRHLNSNEKNVTSAYSSSNGEIPLYIDVLPSETSLTNGTRSKYPSPAPPVPSRPPPVSPRKNKLIHSVSEHTESQTQLYEDIDTLLQKMEIQNGTRSKYPSAAPPVPSRPPPVSPRKNKLIHSVSEHTESQTELYEDLDTLLKEMEIQNEKYDGDENVSSAMQHQPLLPQRSLPEEYHEQVFHPLPATADNSSKELDILMTWWAKVDKWEELSMYYQSEEEETKVFTTKAHRVNMGMRLYEVLLVHHGKILMNHITELRCIADNLDKMGKKTKIASITGGATGAAGGVAAVVGLALAPITFGASLVVSAIGAGVAAAGGVTGASAAISNKVSSTQDRKRVEKILHDCKSKIKDIEGCLEFIHTGMKLLREHDSSTLKGVDEDALRVAMVAEEFGGAKGAVSECSGIVQSFESAMDSYYAKEDSERLKKGSEKNFAQRIREVAEKLKESLDELIRIKNVLRSAASKV